MPGIRRRLVIQAAFLYFAAILFSLQERVRHKNSNLAGRTRCTIEIDVAGLAQLGEPEIEIHPVNGFPGERPHSGRAGR